MAVNNEAFVHIVLDLLRNEISLGNFRINKLMTPLELLNFECLVHHINWGELVWPLLWRIFNLRAFLLNILNYFVEFSNSKRLFENFHWLQIVSVWFGSSQDFFGGLVWIDFELLTLIVVYSRHDKQAVRHIVKVRNWKPKSQVLNLTSHRLVDVDSTFEAYFS